MFHHFLGNYEGGQRKRAGLQRLEDQHLQGRGPVGEELLHTGAGCRPGLCVQGVHGEADGVPQGDVLQARAGLPSMLAQ